MVLPGRSQLNPGTRVLIVEKRNQRTGIFTEGLVAVILTNSKTHPHGIKVRLETGEIGRVKEIVSNNEGNPAE